MGGAAGLNRTIAMPSADTNAIATAARASRRIRFAFDRSGSATSTRTPREDFGYPPPDLTSRRFVWLTVRLYEETRRTVSITLRHRMLTVGRGAQLSPRVSPFRCSHTLRSEERKEHAGNATYWCQLGCVPLD